MARFAVVLALACASVASAQSTCGLGFQALCDAQSAFGSGNITASTIGGNGTYAPKGILNAVYPSISVAEAQQLDPARVSSPPIMYLNLSTNGPIYNRGVLFLLDPDVSNSSALYWMVTNVAINYGSNLLVNGTAAAPYIPPAPGSTPERFVFVLYQQPNNFTLGAPYNTTNTTTTLTGLRLGFNLTSFALQHSLGQPFAGLYFKSANNTGGAATTTAPGTIEYITQSSAPTTIASGSLAARALAAPTAAMRFVRRYRD